MKILNKISIYRILLFGLPVLFLVSCKRDNNYTGRAYFPDMAYSYAFETYGSSPNFSDTVSMLLPVEGTIPRGEIPYQYGAKSFDEQQRAGIELVNPVEVSTENLQRGKEQYDIYCIDCHGEQGRGDGYLFTSKLFPAQPRDLQSDYVQNKPDGELFHVITVGSISGLMGPHGSLIKPADRWKIVTYIKNGLAVK